MTGSNGIVVETWNALKLGKIWFIESFNLKSPMTEAKQEQPSTFVKMKLSSTFTSFVNDVDSTYRSELMISFEANSKMSDELANLSACLLALLNAAAVPVGDFGSTPPTANRDELN